VLQRQSGLGYCSAWAGKVFTSTAARNQFFEAAGRELQPEKEDRLSGLSSEISPDQILTRIHQ
ncbi:MAG TPA: hypothetical protein VN673_06635, partial [Clostridia bacterium]|nr:hypothetical protein [Clostridia bacterium]